MVELPGVHNETPYLKFVLGGSFVKEIAIILIIVGLHALHVLGGVVSLLVMFLKAYFSNTKNYSSVPIEVVSIYWHFVDVLWLYLLVFFIWIR